MTGHPFNTKATDGKHAMATAGWFAFKNPSETEIKRALANLLADYEAEKARADRLAEALAEYIYETTHLATPETLGGREYMNALIPRSEITVARFALADSARTPEGEG